jgi:hypothetical protein
MIAMPMIGDDHIRAGNLPLVSGIVATEIEEWGTAGRCTRNITHANLLKIQQALPRKTSDAFEKSH